MQKRLTIVIAVLFTTGLSTFARGQATYRATFDATWSSSTHSTAYPAGAHFSPLIGATHDASVSLWSPGGIASPGIEFMAESGSTSTLRSEIAAAIGSNRIVSGSGLGSPASATLSFDVTSDSSLITLVTMVAPSPDWFVGVSGLELRDGNGWHSQVTVDLHAYDAGTDSGADFRSQNADTQPQAPIGLVNAPFDGLPPLATLSFDLISLEGDIDGNGRHDCNDINALSNDIAMGSNNAQFDLTGDGTVDLDDRDAWLTIADLPLGDLDIDGIIDSTDLGILLNNFELADPVTLDYCDGDLNADFVVDSTDLGLLLNDYDGVSAIFQAVPEPGSLLLLGVLLVLPYGRRQWSRVGQGVA